MSEILLRQSLCQAARELWARGLVVADSGMLSAEVHRRRFLVTPVGLRRSDLREADLAVVDIAGMDLVGGPTVAPATWQSHRIAYRVGLDRESAGARNGNTLPFINATILVTPPNLIAMLRLSPDIHELRLPRVDPLKIIPSVEEEAVRDALAISQGVIFRDSESLMVAAPDLGQAVNFVERIEHAATIELLCHRHV